MHVYKLREITQICLSNNESAVFSEALNQKATSYLVKVVFIGLTRFDTEGKKIDGDLGHGVIAKEGIVVKISPDQKNINSRQI